MDLEAKIDRLTELVEGMASAGGSPERLLTADQAAKLLSVSKTRFYGLVSEGAVGRGVRLGGKRTRRWRVAEVLRAAKPVREPRRGA